MQDDLAGRDNLEMLPVCDLAIRVLIYGLDADLLETRELLLSQAGFSVKTATNCRRFQKLAAEADLPYALFVLCHTVPKEERPTLQQVATSIKAAVYQLTDAVSPEAFLKHVSIVLAR